MADGDLLWHCKNRFCKGIGEQQETSLAFTAYSCSTCGRGLSIVPARSGNSVQYGESPGVARMLTEREQDPSTTSCYQWLKTNALFWTKQNTKRDAHERDPRLMEIWEETRRLCENANAKEMFLKGCGTENRLHSLFRKFCSSWPHQNFRFRTRKSRRRPSPTLSLAPGDVRLAEHGFIQTRWRSETGRVRYQAAQTVVPHPEASLFNSLFVCFSAAKESVCHHPPEGHVSCL